MEKNPRNEIHKIPTVAQEAVGTGNTPESVSQKGGLPSPAVEPVISQQIARDLAGVQRQLYVYIFSLVPNRTDAEDILQNTNQVIVSKQDTASGLQNFLSWAKRVAYFEILAWRKKCSRDRLVFVSDSLMREPEYSSEVQEQADYLSALDKCKELLSEKERSLLSLRYQDGFSASSIAMQNQTNENSIRQQLYRIRNRLLKCIQKRLAFQGGTS